MNTRRSTGSIGRNKNNNNNNNNNSISYSNSKMNSYLVGSSLTTKTITPELHAINAKICRLVEQHPCMYDRSHPSYMRKSHVDRAWEDISKQMNDSVDNCKERFRNIRTSFARSINVQRGTNRIKPYYLSEELEFLKKHITPGVPVPVKGRRSRDSSNRRGDENDEYDENDEDEPPEALLHIKHSLSSDEYAHDEDEEEEEGSSGPASSAEWVSDEHAPEKHDSEPEQQRQQQHSQSEEEEQKPSMNQLLQATRACSFPPKKRRRMAAAEVAKTSEPAADADPAADTKSTTCPDFDDAFLQGLRPEMKHMNFHQKLYFKRRVYELLGEIFDGSSSSQTAYTNGQTPATATSNSSAARATAAPSPTSLQHLGLLARSGALQLPKLAPKPSKDL